MMIAVGLPNSLGAHGTAPGTRHIAVVMLAGVSTNVILEQAALFKGFYGERRASQ
ncbi:MAG: hypothetical protein ACLU38_11715 [Dysosmobacter sp.]